MIELIDNCVDCGLPCIHNSCPYYARDYLVCDVCGAPIRPAEEEDYSCIEYVCDTCCEKNKEGNEEWLTSD